MAAQVTGLQTTNLQTNLQATAMSVPTQTTNIPQNTATATSIPYPTNDSTSTTTIQQPTPLQQLNNNPQMAPSIQAANIQLSTLNDTVPAQTTMPAETPNMPLQVTGLTAGVLGGVSGNVTAPMLVLGQDRAAQGLPSGFAVAQTIQGLQAFQLPGAQLPGTVSNPTVTAPQIQNGTSDGVAN